jgi:hypothetical protein
VEEAAMHASIRRTVTAAALLVLAGSASPLMAEGPRASDPPPRGAGAQPLPPASDRSAGAITGGLPAMRGVTPSRAELPDSAFVKLDANQRGYLTREDTLPLAGFEEAFRVGDRNGDGRLDSSEFHEAWTRYSSSTR